MRYKGQRTTRMNERDYPHIVEIVAEPRRTQEDYRVWGVRLDAMLGWHHERGVPIIRGRSRHVEQSNYEYVDYFRWCFADAMTAEAFRSKFGGDLVRLAQHDRVLPRPTGQRSR